MSLVASNSRARSSSDTYTALIVGLRDYVSKNGFPGIVLGLSGGIDSALSAVVAVDALGSDRVLGVRLPSPFTGRSAWKKRNMSPIGSASGS